MKRQKNRYLICYIDPQTGRERLGSGPSSQTFGYYVSIDNLLKYQLSMDHYPAGQYHIYVWQEGTEFSEQQPTTVYKRATRNKATKTYRKTVVF